MKKGKSIILAVSAIVSVTAAAVYLFIIRLRNGAIICGRKSDN